MSRTRAGAVVLAALLAAGLAAAAAAAERPAALAVDVVGATEPPLDPYSELLSGDSVTLAADARVELLHYNTCETTVVRGGRVTVTDRRVLTKGGKILDRRRSKCPKAVTLGSEGAVGGVLMRSGANALKLTTEPAFTVVGAGAVAHATVRVLKGGAPVLEASLEGRRFAWPDGAPPLAPGTDYTLELVPARGAEPHVVDFEVVESRGRPPLTLVRIE